MNEPTPAEDDVLKTDLHIQAAYRLTEALVESEKKMRRRIELLAEVVFETDASGITRFLNGAWSDILGYELKESMGTRLQEYVLEEDRPLFRAYYDRIDRFEPRYPQELRLVGRDGSIIWMEMSAKPLDDGGMVGTLYNVTQRKQMQRDLEVTKEAAERANEAKSVFLAAMSHEIRTPMNGVLGMISLLLEGALDSDQRNRANIIKTSGEALLAIVNDILDYSKIESGRFSLAAESFKPRVILDDTVSLFKGSAETKRISLTGAFTGDDSLSVVGDRGRLRQVMMNLVSNAVKFTVQGVVGVEMQQFLKDGLVEIRVSVHDTGIGIAEGDLSRLFVHFSQVDASATRKAGGTGLGLAISKQLVEMMGGQIGVETKHGKGSTFWFYVRLPGAKNSAIQATSFAVHREHNFKGLHALVAEDNIVNQMVLQGILDGMGCIVDIVENGREAIESVSNRSYDFVMMDVHMPEMDGLEATRVIRKYSQIPVIGVTANVMPEHVKMCLDSGMNGFVPKPVSRQSIETEIGRVLSCRTV